MRATELRVLATSLAILSSLAFSASARTPVLDAESLADAREGLDHLYHARESDAAAAFERIRVRHPESPAADFLLGGIAWHRMVTGPAGASEGPAKRAFLERMDATIEVGERAVERDPADLSARFFLGGAYGYKARQLALDEKWWDAYRTGKKGVEQLEYVVREDPEFADAYLGLGIYHYYADVLPSVLKLFAGIVGVHGDKASGLAEIGRALDEGVLVPVECRFFLAEIQMELENDAWTALGYSRSLRDEFPENELFTWMNARVLDELHLSDAAIAEWESLRSKPRRASHRGFLTYRLARSKLFGADFEGAATDLERNLAAQGLGSRRMNAWGNLRLGEALDFLGRHDDALVQYRLAKDQNEGGLLEERASARLSAGKRDASVVSLEEIAEVARILKSTRRQGEPDLRRIEDFVTAPNRGLSSDQVRLYFEILRDLAEARLRRGDARGCLEAIERAMHDYRSPPKESRSILLELRGTAKLRLGDREAAIRDLDEARSRAAYAERDRLDQMRAFVRSWVLHVRQPPKNPEGTTLVEFRAPDGGELLVQVEGDFLPAGTKLPMRLDDGMWRATYRVSPPGPIRYRFLANGATPHVDASAARIRWEHDGAWSYRDLPPIE